MDEFFVVDRVENNIAVLECPDGKFLNVEVDSLPFKVREGNVLLKKSDIFKYIAGNNKNEIWAGSMVKDGQRKKGPEVSRFISETPINPLIS